MLVDMKVLRFCLRNKYNVLLEGEAGVGKTAIIKQVFEEANLNYAYFSGSTLDPFVDFVGIPVKVDLPDGSVIRLIRPERLATGDINVIFIDELNRTHKKVRNAVMELMQFGTINGEPLCNPENWYGVWGAINPDNVDDIAGDYDTDRLDRAQRDRFQIQIKIPYECDEEYFIKQYGDRNGKAAVQYWNDLPPEQKKLVSPRRLDYAMNVFERHGDVRLVLPHTSSPKRLTDILSAGPAGAKLQKLYDDNDKDGAKLLLSDDNSYNYVLKAILDNRKFIKFFLPLMPADKFSSLYNSEKDVRKQVNEDLETNKDKSPFLAACSEIAKANTNYQVATQIRTILDGINIAVAPVGIDEWISEDTLMGYETQLEEMAAQDMTQMHTRKKSYEKVLQCSPAEMTNNASWHGLSVSNKIAASHIHTIRASYPNLIGFINHCICSLIRNGVDSDDIVAKLKNYPKILNYMRQTGSASVIDLERYVKEAQRTGVDPNQSGNKRKALAI
jgi:hypothetical protein